MSGRRPQGSARRRIAFIDYFPPHYRRGLYEEIARRMDADFYFFSDERERWQNREIAAVYEGEYRRVELTRLRIAGQALLPGLPRALSSRRYDAVIKTLNGKLMLPLTYAAARARGVAFVLWLGMWHHPTTSFHRRTRGLTEAVYRGSDAIVTYGEHVKRFVSDVPGVTPAKVFCAGQAVDPARFEAVRPTANGETAVLFIGQFKEYKGVRPLLDAMELLDRPQARLRLVGNGPLEGEIRARSARLPNVDVVGHLPQEKLPGELARARCLVLPSVTTQLDREPWGLVVNEAMHAGVPVIASTAVGAAAGGLVRDASNGFVVPERDPAALAAAMRRLIDDSGLATQLGAAARHDVRAFDYRRMADGFERGVEYALAARSLAADRPTAPSA